jgi:DNA recombination protein RmuC
MEPILLIAVLVGALAVGALGAVLVVRRMHTGHDGTERESAISALEARLAQMTDAQAAQQAQFSEALRNQERALAKSVEEKLLGMTQRVGETLEKNDKNQKTTLNELRERLVRIDTAQKNLTELSSQVVGLQEILSNKQARGAFGEVQLQDLVESVMPPGSYSFQATVGDGKRADCLLDLPNPPGPMVVDAKFPLEAWRQLQEAGTESARTEAARAFRRDVATHVKAISEKYIVPGETADAALMFLPSEAVYAELHANFGDAVDAAHRAKVFIVSPTTLWALLNTMRAVMKDVRMKEAAGIIQTEVLKMLEDVARLDDRVGKLESHFDQAGRDIKQIRTSADKITRRGDAIQEIQLGEANGDAITDAADDRPRLRSVE